MDNVVILLLVVSIIFSGVSFIIITEMLKRVTSEVNTILRLEKKKVRKETETVIEHSIPMPNFIETDDLK